MHTQTFGPNVAKNQEMHAHGFVFTGLLTLHSVVKTAASSTQPMGCCPLTMMGVAHNYSLQKRISCMLCAYIWYIRCYMICTIVYMSSLSVCTVTQLYRSYKQNRGCCSKNNHVLTPLNSCTHRINHSKTASHDCAWKKKRMLVPLEMSNHAKQGDTLVSNLQQYCYCFQCTGVAQAP